MKTFAVKIAALLLLLAPATDVLYAQKSGKKQKKEKDKTEVTVNERLPGFGKKYGQEATIEFQRWVIRNLKYPAQALKNKAEGTVMVMFVVNKEGKVVDARVMKSVDPDLDEAALNTILNSPLWTPGIQKGQPVNVKYMVPVSFSLRNP